MGCFFPAGAHLVPLARAGGGGILASPTRGQKSSLRLIAQQTAAEAEQNANVALLARQAKKVQGERLSVAAAWLLWLWGRTGGSQRRLRRQFSTPALLLF